MTNPQVLYCNSRSSSELTVCVGRPQTVGRGGGGSLWAPDTLASGDGFMTVHDKSDRTSNQPGRAVEEPAT